MPSKMLPCVAAGPKVHKIWSTQTGKHASYLDSQCFVNNHNTPGTPAPPPLSHVAHPPLAHAAHHWSSGQARVTREIGIWVVEGSTIQERLDKLHVRIDSDFVTWDQCKLPLPAPAPAKAASPQGLKQLTNPPRKRDLKSKRSSVRMN